MADIAKHYAAMPRPDPGVAVEVRASGRLHLGFFDLHGGLGRRFGSLGVAIDGPEVRVSVRAADALHCEGPSAERAAQFVQDCARHLGLSADVAVQVEQALPAHAGLGSGTQLALAVGTALERLHGLHWPAAQTAAALERGARSGIGIGAFEQGGFLVDGGSDPHTAAAPPILARFALPAAWRWILVYDDARSGLSGRAETQAFANLAPFPSSDAAELCRRVLMQAMPGAAEGDIRNFGAAITALQDRVGDYFAGAQGARYASAEVGRALGVLRDAGAAAVGQTSWGPTGFALAASPAEAESLVTALRAAMPGTPLRIHICTTRNRGADVSVRHLRAQASALVSIA